MRLIDTFMFFNEFDILDIRLHELSDIVDRFVLVESITTHRGNLKPLYFEENKTLFKKFLNRIVHVVVTEVPNTSDWDREFNHRENTFRGLWNCDRDDIIMISDVDEIPDKEIFCKYDFTKLTDRFATAVNLLFYYYLNTYFEQYRWPGTVFIRCDYLEQRGFTDVRLKRKKGLTIPNCGWHFSYIGDAENMQNKISSFSHSEYDNDKVNNKEFIQSCMQELKSPFGSRGPGEAIMTVADPSTIKLPKYITDNLDRFSKYIRKDS